MILTKRGITRHVPNTITLLNLVVGCLSIASAFEGNLLLAAYLIVVAACFDFLDGLAARILKSYSPLGKELDSLADAVSFGVAPSVILYQLLKAVLAVPYDEGFATGHTILVIPFIMAAFSALRLAMFNVDSRQTTSFIGLPTPANALYTAGLVLGLYSPYHSLFHPLVSSASAIVVMVLVQSALLVSPIPMFSLKLKSLRWGEAGVQIIFFALSCALILLLGVAALAPIILLYLSISLVSWAIKSIQ